MSSPSITVSAIVNAPIEKVWECWTKPEASEYSKREREADKLKGK
jgi:hypothetical protein